MTGYPVPKPALKAAITILSAALPEAVVGTKLPRVWSDTVVVVSRVGGGMPLLVTDAARILVECYAATVAACEQLANECRAALRNAQGTFAEDAFIREFTNEEGPVGYFNPEVPDFERWQFQGDLLVSTS